MGFLYPDALESNVLEATTFVALITKAQSLRLGLSN